MKPKNTNRWCEQATMLHISRRHTELLSLLLFFFRGLCSKPAQSSFGKLGDEIGKCMAIISCRWSNFLRRWFPPILPPLTPSLPFHSLLTTCSLSIPPRLQWPSTPHIKKNHYDSKIATVMHGNNRPRFYSECKLHMNNIGRNDPFPNRNTLRKNLALCAKTQMLSMSCDMNELS